MKDRPDELIREIRRERIARARQKRPAEKLFGGAELFDASIEWMRRGIKLQNPHASEERVLELLADRLDRTAPARKQKGNGD